MVRFALLLAVMLEGQAGSTARLPAIERHHVGEIALGVNAQKVYEAFPANRRDLVDLRHEGMLTPALLLRFVGTTQRDGIVAELAGDQTGLIVWRIEIREPAFRTLKGIGVGSTVAELRAAYHMDSLLSGEGNVVIRIEELSASFVLDQTGPGGERLERLRTPAAVPDSVKIRSVLLTR